MNFGDIPGNAPIPEDAIALGATGLAKGSFSAYRSTTQAIAGGAVVVWDAEEFDVSGWYDVATGAFTPQVAGYYRLTAFFMTSAGASVGSLWECRLRKNAASWKQLGNMAAAAGEQVGAGGTALVQANGSTDAFDIAIFHNAGGSPTIRGDQVRCFFQGELVGRS